jgi:hypothetical protein
MTTRAALACALMFALVAGKAAPASATTPYQASLTNPSCVGNTSCSIIFQPVPASHRLTISHVSCRIVGTGNGNGNPGVVCATLRISAQTPATDLLPISSLFNYIVTSVGYTSTVINVDTLYFVAAGASPQVDILMDGTISTPNTAVDEPTCFVSGYTTP